MMTFLLEGGLDASERLRHELQGKRSYRKGGIRLIFAHCEECRELGEQLLNGCNECDSNSDDTLRFFAYGSRQEIYERLKSHQIY
jgi:hypothetical protein